MNATCRILLFFQLHRLGIKTWTACIPNNVCLPLQAGFYLRYKANKQCIPTIKSCVIIH